MSELDRFRAALTEIAKYDDEGANARLSISGSYGSFDEPGAVQTAREVLKAYADVSTNPSPVKPFLSPYGS